MVFTDAANYVVAEVTFLKQDNDRLLGNTLHLSADQS